MDHEQQRKLQLRDALERQKMYRKEGEERYNEQSKKRLSKIVETKLKTAFIGALSAFEENLGDFLADPKVKERWEKARNRILDNGNSQIRALKKEFEQYEIHWRRNQVSYVSDGNILKRKPQ